MVRKPTQGFQNGHPAYNIDGGFRSGNLPHNKGMRGYVNAGSFKSGHAPLLDQCGEKNPMWKGDSVSYSGLHRWVRRMLGTPNKCEACGTTEASRFEWANKSHEYKRDVSDWMRLCPTCHHEYDRRSREAINL